MILSSDQNWNIRKLSTDKLHKVYVRHLATHICVSLEPTRNRGITAKSPSVSAY